MQNINLLRIQRITISHCVVSEPYERIATIMIMMLAASLIYAHYSWDYDDYDYCDDYDYDTSLIYAQHSWPIQRLTISISAPEVL